MIAEDSAQHFERRLEAMDGKAMVVGMSRRICVDLYNELIKLRPDWASTPDDDIEAEKKQSTVVKIVMTGSADEAIRLRDDIAFFQAVRSALVKPSAERKTRPSYIARPPSPRFSTRSR